jgi:hypothetical protein
LKTKEVSVRSLVTFLTIKAELDQLTERINLIEGDFHKKLKTIRSHVDFLSHFEDYFRKKEAHN